VDRLRHLNKRDILAGEAEGGKTGWDDHHCPVVPHPIDGVRRQIVNDFPFNREGAHTTSLLLFFWGGALGIFYFGALGFFC